MTKAIASYPKAEQGKVVSARLVANVGGLGTLAAKDAQEGALRKELISKGLIKPAQKEANVS